MGKQARVSRTPAPKTGHVVRDSSFNLAPDLLEPVVLLINRVWSASSVNPALLEMLRLRNARTVNCVACKAVRYDEARQDGMTEEKASRIDDGYPNSDLSEREKLALEFADVYLKDPAGASPALLQRLRAVFSERQIGDMAVALTTFNAMSRCAVSLGGMPESMPVFSMAVPTA